MMNTILIPAYEPGDALAELTTRLRAATDARILVVNDGSGPSYERFFRNLGPDVQVLGYAENAGKGHAIRHALEYIEKQDPGPGFIVTADADGQHTPEDILRVLGAAEANPGTLVLGSRVFGSDVPNWSLFGNTVTLKVFAWVSGARVTDTQTGLRAFSVSAIPFLLKTEGERYEYEMNVLMDWAESGRPFREIPIATVYHDASNSCSHFRTLTDSARIYKQILKRATPLLFALSSFSSFLLDYVLFLVLLKMFGQAAWAVIASNIAARLVSAAFNYHLNRMIVFRSRGSVVRTGLAYAMLALGILAGNSVILALYNDVLGLAPALAKVFTEITLFISSYTVQRYLIFRSCIRKKKRGIWHDAESKL